MYLDSFRLQTAAFEARYEAGWRLWDRSGELWAKVRTKYPELKLITAQPNVTTFRIGSQCELSVEIDKTATRSHNPGRSLGEFQGVAQNLLDVAANALGISEFTRLGIRLIFLREYPSLEEASAALLSLKVLRIPDAPNFGVKGGLPLSPEYGIRWENEDFGATLRMKAENLLFKQDLPFGWEGPTLMEMDKELAGFYLDVDYFTKSIVNVNQLKADEWIGTAYHNIRRDLTRILEG